MLRPFILFLSLCFGVHAFAQDGTPTGSTEQDNSVTVVVELLASAADAPKLRVSLCPNVNAFIAQAGCIRQNIFVEGNVVRLEFSDVPPGDYAVMAYLDLNDNDVLDVAPSTMTPMEPYGYANNPVTVTGHPTFPQAMVSLRGGHSTVRITLR